MVSNILCQPGGGILSTSKGHEIYEVLNLCVAIVMILRGLPAFSPCILLCLLSINASEQTRNVKGNGDDFTNYLHLVPFAQAVYYNDSYADIW
jgi:hypothetical protein